jgi:hypothetical protein
MTVACRGFRYHSVTALKDQTPSVMIHSHYQITSTFLYQWRPESIFNNSHQAVETYDADREYTHCSAAVLKQGIQLY